MEREAEATMRDQLQKRLDALRNEFEVGRQRLAELEQQTAKLRETLLRISGAIQVLEEELGSAELPASSSPPEG
jgi:predicted nuclease with TOPRIM domain